MRRKLFASNQFLREDGELPPSSLESMLYDWLPARKQALNALQLQFEPYREELDPYPPTSVWFTSMRQGLGLVVLTALIAGFLPFLVNLFLAGRVGVVVPLADLVRGAQDIPPDLLPFFGGGWQALQTAAGSPPAVFPGWLAAGLSALGLWLNWPLNWLAIWIVYGAAVALFAHWLGSPVTMQRFYALTSYASLPLMLTGLIVIPCLGFLAGLFGFLYAGAVYVFAVRAVTGLSAGRAIIATLAPLGIMLALGSIFALSLATFLFRMLAFNLGV